MKLLAIFSIGLCLVSAALCGTESDEPRCKCGKCHCTKEHNCGCMDGGECKCTPESNCAEETH